MLNLLLVTRLLRRKMVCFCDQFSGSDCINIKLGTSSEGDYNSIRVLHLYYFKFLGTVVGVRLPGRETRRNEAAVSELKKLVPLIGDAIIKQYSDKPFAFLGHRYPLQPVLYRYLQLHWNLSIKCREMTRIWRKIMGSFWKVSIN